MATEHAPQDSGTSSNSPHRVRRSPPPGRVIPFPAGEAPTKEEADAANAGRYAPRGIERFFINLTRNWAVRLGLAGGAAWATYQVPAIHEYVDARYQDLLQSLGLTTVVPPIFNNSLNEGVIGDNNITDLSLLEINQKFPNQVVEEDSFLTFLSPIVLPDGTKMPYGRKDVTSFNGGYATEELKKEAEAKQTKDYIEFTLPAGGILISPVDGYGYIDMDKDVAQHDPRLATSFFVVYYDEVRNKTYKIWVFGQDPKTTNFNLTSLAPNLEMSANFPASERRGTAWKNYPEMKRGQPLIKATKDQPMILILEAYNGNEIVPAGNGRNNTKYMLTPRFYTVDNQLVALQK